MGEKPGTGLTDSNTGGDLVKRGVGPSLMVLFSSLQVTLVRNYTRSCLIRDWLRGCYSHVRSAEELNGRKMTPLDAETWGEILQAELDR